MKGIITLFMIAVTFGLTAQKKEVSVEAATYGYSIGTQPSIIVTIPNGDKKIIEKLLKKETSSWGGKTKNVAGEYQTMQASSKKFIEGKVYDAYTRMYQDMQDIKIAVAVDLGGAYMTETDHPLQFNEFKARMYQFALTAAKAMLANDAKAEQKNLKALQKELKSFEKEKGKYEKNIQGFEKKIAENKTSIEEVEKKIASKKEDITKQEGLIKEIKNTTVK